jgi:hypothetical protein
MKLDYAVKVPLYPRRHGKSEIGGERIGMGLAILHKNGTRAEVDVWRNLGKYPYSIMQLVEVCLDVNSNLLLFNQWRDFILVRQVAQVNTTAYPE